MFFNLMLLIFGLGTAKTVGDGTRSDLKAHDTNSFLWNIHIEAMASEFDSNRIATILVSS